jgi:hypothetical protein
MLSDYVAVGILTQAMGFRRNVGHSLPLVRPRLEK